MLSRLQKQYDAEIALYSQKLENEIALDEENNERLQRIAEEKQKKVAEQNELELERFTFAKDAVKFAQDYEKTSETQRRRFLKKNSTGILGDLAQYSKKAFEANKAFQTGQAVIEGYGAIQKALNAAPPPFNIALAAIVAAQTAVQIRGIQSATFGAASTPTPPSGAVPSSGAVPANASLQTAPAAPVTNITVALDNIDEDGIYTGKVLRKITDEIAKQLSSGVSNARFA